MKADVFVSYKREDEARVARVVRGLEAAGLSVWWDRALPGGENWRANIEAALDASKVVIVCWTQGSVGPDGRFVRDEASLAGNRLVPVLLQRGVRPPLGFGEIQAIDLSRWNGGKSDPFFQDLLALVLAKRDGFSPPKPKGPGARALRRFVYGGGLTAVALGALAFAWSTPVVRETSCALPVAGLARTCCLAGFTDKVEMRDKAWTPFVSEIPMYLRNSEQRFEDKSVAQTDARARLSADAQQACSIADPFTQRLAVAEPRAVSFDCRASSLGWGCAANYIARCEIEEQRLVKVCPES